MKHLSRLDLTTDNYYTINMRYALNMISMKKAIWIVFLVGGFGCGFLKAQTTVSFNFSAGAQPVSGWINVAGDPSVAVRTATDPTSGIAISSVSTGNWVPLSSSGTAAFDGGGMTNGTFFPAAVMLNHWFQTNPALSGYNASVPQLQITGLKVDSVYTLSMTGSWASNNYSLNPTQYTVSGATVYGYVDVDANFNTANGAVFHNVAPDATGTIKIYVNTVSTSQIADICGIEIIQVRTTAPTPVVSITNPINNDVFPEDGNLTLSATATETGGSITMVQFYAGSTLIGTDSTAPYNLVWYSPNEGPYTITARAIDGTGNTGTASVNISVESLTSFWSMTGNIGMNPDSNFVGNVDSVRLAFRTKNLERMSISPIGNVGIGVDTPTAQLHTTGTVRLAGLRSDSTKTRVLVSDTSGNLYYRNLSALGLATGGGLGQSGDTLMLGDSIPGPGPHSFTSDRYQYLNGHMYSIGGTADDPVNHPAFRIYDNGDLAAGTTMDRSYSTGNQTGMRYYSKLGVMQLGASDRLDTAQSEIVYGIWPGSGLLINSDDSNSIKGMLMNTVLAGDLCTMDTLTYMENNFVTGGSLHFGLGGHSGQVLGYSLVAGNSMSFTNSATNAVITGAAHTISKPVDVISINGYANTTMDTARGSTISGAQNLFGGLDQLVAGNYLVNRSPYGTTLGNANVDFSTLNYTGIQGVFSASAVAQYPLFALGNSSNMQGTMRSNALTVLFNGRTQINTTGYTQALTQTAVTPKAALEVVSTNSGVLLPKLTSAQRNAIATADLVNGLLLYNTDSNAFQFYNGSAWNTVGSGVSPTSRWQFSGSTVYDSLDNIGIGTSNTQGYKLAVNGAGIFTKVRIKPQASWPDYVFKKDYHLPGLAEVEQYITDHQHLPGIISEAEQLKDGIDVGGNQAAMLQKIEELTLYVIQQNKAREEQEKRLEQQQSQLQSQQAQLQVQQQEIEELKKLIRARN